MAAVATDAVAAAPATALPARVAHSELAVPHGGSSEADALWMQVCLASVFADGCA